MVRITLRSVGDANPHGSVEESGQFDCRFRRVAACLARARHRPRAWKHAWTLWARAPRFHTWRLLCRKAPQDLVSDLESLARELAQADIVIGAVLVPGGVAPNVLRRADLGPLKLSALSSTSPSIRVALSSRPGPPPTRTTSTSRRVSALLRRQHAGGGPQTSGDPARIFVHGLAARRRIAPCSDSIGCERFMLWLSMGPSLQQRLLCM